MRIIQVITCLNLGGAQTLLENLSYGLKDAGHDVIVISLENYHSATAQRIEDRGIQVIYLDKKPHYDPTIAGKLGEVLKSLKPDIIHAHNIKKAYVYLAAKKAKVKRVVYTVHNMAWQEQGVVGGLFSYLMFHTGCMVPVGLSPKVTESIEQRYHLKNVPTVYNGTDLSRFSVKTEYSLHDEPSILNVARLDAQKNHKRLIESFAIVSRQFPAAKLVIVGEGELQETLESQTKESGLTEKVLFEGLQDDIPKYMKDADVFCLSSDYEGMPMTLIEAMAAGMPIVSTNVGGISDMLTNEGSAILTGLDATELANAVIRILSNKDLREKLGKNAYEASQEFSHRRMTQKYISIYKKILKH